MSLVVKSLQTSGWWEISWKLPGPWTGQLTCKPVVTFDIWTETGRWFQRNKRCPWGVERSSPGLGCPMIGGDPVPRITWWSGGWQGGTVSLVHSSGWARMCHKWTGPSEGSTYISRLRVQPVKGSHMGEMGSHAGLCKHMCSIALFWISWRLFTEFLLQLSIK